MKVLITGATGFLGSHLVDWLLNRGHTVYAIIHPNSDYHFSRNTKNLYPIRMNLRELDEAKLPSDIDALYTLPQSRKFRQFPETAQDIFEVNVVSHFALWEWARKSNVPSVIHASSGGIYGMSDNQNALKEDHLVTVNPDLGFYLSTKLCSETILQNYKPYFKSLILLRPFFLFGPGQQNDMLVARLIHSIKNSLPISLQGTEGMTFNPVAINDATEAFGCALEISGHHVINVAGAEIFSLKSFCTKISSIVGKQALFIQTPGTPANYLACTDKMKTLLGVSPTSIQRVLENMI